MTKNKQIKRLPMHPICMLLVFIYIFAFRIVSVVDSAIIVGIFLCFNLLFNKKYRVALNKILGSHRFLKIVITFTLFICWIIFAVLVNCKNDFSFIKTLLHLIIQLFIGVLLFAYLKLHGQTKNTVNYIVVVFVLQAIIMILGTFLPPVRDLLLLTKSEHERELALHYGYRGASLSGSSFFGLAISFGIMFVFFVTGKNRIGKSNPYILIAFVALLIVAALSAGRVSIIGLFFAILYLLLNINKISRKSKRRFSVAFIVVMIAVCIAFILLRPLLPEGITYLVNQYLFYITEFFSSASGGAFHTTSTDYLFENMFFLISLKQFFIGDGMYTLENGAYYMATDSGYMRPILYVGIIGLIFLFVIEWQILNFCNMRSKNKKLFYCILILTLVLQLKGEVMGFALIYNSIIWLVSLSYGEEREKNESNRCNVRLRRADKLLATQH